MKTLHYINLTSFLITIGLYGSIHFIIYGMIASIFLGAIQLLLGIILMIYYKDLNEIHQNYLKTYWTLVMVNITAIIMIPHTGIDMNYLNPLIISQITPMLIASYFVFITYQIQKS